MRVEIPAPDGVSGEWQLDTVMIPEADAEREGVAAGPMRRLLRGTVCVMTNSEREWGQLEPLRTHASGRVLINGLGMGLALVAILDKPKVAGVTVIEKSVDVIRLITPHLPDSKWIVLQEDARTVEWSPSERFDTVWHDIWDTSGPEHDAEMRALWARYEGRCGWQGVWSRPQWM